MHKNRNKLARLLMTGVIASPFIFSSDFRAIENTQVASPQQNITDSEQNSTRANLNQLSGGLCVSGREGVEWNYVDGTLTILPSSESITLSGSSKTDKVVVSPDFNGIIILAGVELNNSLIAPKSDIVIAADTINRITSSDLALKCEQLIGKGYSSKLFVTSANSGVEVTKYIEKLDLNIVAKDIGLTAHDMVSTKVTCEANVCVYIPRYSIESIEKCIFNLKAVDTGIKCDNNMRFVECVYEISGVNGILGGIGNLDVVLSKVTLNCSNIGIGGINSLTHRIDVRSSDVINLKSCNAIVGYYNENDNVTLPDINLYASNINSANPVSVGTGYLSGGSIHNYGGINIEKTNLNISATKVGIGSVVENKDISRIKINGGEIEITSLEGIGIGCYEGISPKIIFEEGNVSVINAKMPPVENLGGLCVINRSDKKLDYDIKGKVVNLSGDQIIDKDNLSVYIGKDYKLVTDSIQVKDYNKEDTYLNIDGFLELNKDCALTNSSIFVNNGVIYGKVVDNGGTILGGGKVIDRDYSKNQPPTKPNVRMEQQHYNTDKNGNLYVKFELIPSTDPEGDKIEYVYEGDYKSGYYAPGDYSFKVYAVDSYGAKSETFEKTFTVPDIREPLDNPKFNINITGKYNDKGECLVELIPITDDKNLTYEYTGKSDDNYYKPGKHIVKVRAKSPSSLFSDWVILEFEVPVSEVSAKPDKPEIKATVTDDYDKDGRCLVKIDLIKSSEGKDITYEYIGLSKDNRYKPGKHQVGIRAKDLDGKYSDWYFVNFEVPKENKIPAKPELTVAVTDKYNSKGECLVKVVLSKPSKDPEGEDVIYEYAGLGIGNHYYSPGSYSVAVRAKDTSGKHSEWFSVMFVVPEKSKTDDFIINITTHEALIGKDRYETANKIAKESKTNKLIVFNASKSIVDGLSASALAGKLNANILPINPNKLNEESLRLIKNANEVYIMGLYDAVPKKFEDNIRGKVMRIGGKDRYETSEKVANYVGHYNNAFLVNGEIGQADAMSIAPVAARDASPILLVNNKSNRFTPDRNINYTAIGGRDVIPSSYVNRFRADRIGGEDRYATNRRVLETYYRWKDKIYFCNGETLVDALSGSYLAKDYGIALVNQRNNHYLLTEKSTIQLGGLNFKLK